MVVVVEVVVVVVVVATTTPYDSLKACPQSVLSLLAVVVLQQPPLKPMSVPIVPGSAPPQLALNHGVEHAPPGFPVTSPQQSLKWQSHPLEHVHADGRVGGNVSCSAWPQIDKRALTSPTRPSSSGHEAEEPPK